MTWPKLKNLRSDLKIQKAFRAKHWLSELVFICMGVKICVCFEWPDPRWLGLRTTVTVWFGRNWHTAVCVSPLCMYWVGVLIYDHLQIRCLQYKTDVTKWFPLYCSSVCLQFFLCGVRVDWYRFSLST